MKTRISLLVALFGIAALTLQVKADSVPEVLHYKFSGTGTSVPNLASAPPAGTETATIMGGLTQGIPDLNTGGGGGSLIGTGLSSTTDYLNTGWAPNLGGGSWTISFVTSNLAGTSTLYYIFGDLNTSSFRCFTNGVAGANNWILRGGGFTDTTINGGAGVGKHRTTIVYDSVANNVKGYVDGVLVTTVAQTAPNFTGVGPFKVMGYSANVGAPAGGLLDDFRLYSRALTDVEVADIDVRPVMVVSGNGATIADGDTTPDTADHTDFGSVTGGNSVVRTFTIANSGNTDLTFGNINITGAHAGDFVVTAAPTSPVTPIAASTTFNVTFTPGGAGLRTATVSFTSNDPSKQDFNFDIQGTGDLPEIVVKDGGGDEVLDGTGAIGFGSAKAGGLPRIQNVTIENIGTAALTGLSVSIDGANFRDFTAAALPADSLNASGSQSFSVTFTPSGVGARTAVMRIASNDLDENSYDITLNGTGTTISTVVSNVALRTNDAAPGAGTNGLPAAAGPASPVITAFNPPATDDDGSLAYIAKWKTPTAKGTGLFLNNKCLGVVGGDAPIAGAKWVSFTDPVVDGGSVVSIAKLTGKPTPPASVVVSNATVADTLEVIARAGEVAPLPDGSQPVGGAVFKSFKAVSIQRGAIGFLAQLSGGTGAQKVTANNGMGLWAKNGTGPLKRLIREGQVVNGKTIKTIVSYKPGAVSPGQGRGWLTKGSGLGVTMALATMTDNSQAIVSSDTNGTTIFYSQTGTTAVIGSPSIAGTSFASYGLPAANEKDINVFPASLKVGAGGVTTANARGIFIGGYQSTYTPIARITDPAGATGATFSKLGDPILSADGDVAFLATIKGGTVKGPATNTLWLKDYNSPLALIASGGARPGPDLPTDAQWQSFSSLAIARDGNGVILSAKLVPKKGGVTPANASGVWAFDFNGVPRLLFRTGDTIGGKVVKSFTLLKALPGSTGVTRSVNNSATVVWLATFADKTTAIVRTEVP